MQSHLADLREVLGAVPEHRVLQGRRRGRVRRLGGGRHPRGAWPSPRENRVTGLINAQMPTFMAFKQGQKIKETVGANPQALNVCAPPPLFFFSPLAYYSVP
jgi:hypothetical protein